MNEWRLGPLRPLPNLCPRVDREKERSQGIMFRSVSAGPIVMRFLNQRMISVMCLLAYLLAVSPSVIAGWPGSGMVQHSPPDGVCSTKADASGWSGGCCGLSGACREVVAPAFSGRHETCGTQDSRSCRCPGGRSSHPDCPDCPGHCHSCAVGAVPFSCSSEGGPNPPDCTGRLLVTAG